MDTRIRGKLTKRLAGIAGKVIRPTDLLDDGKVVLPPRVAVRVPDCANCPDRCCVHKEPDSGILLSLRDVAHLVDSGLADLIVGRFTFRKDRNGRVTEDVEDMPRLAKQPDGNCHFYDESTGRCTGYGVRPTICRRYPYEVAYRPGSGKPFARFIPWATCPTIPAERSSPGVAQMIRDSVFDENIAFEDAMMLPDFLEDLRRVGFGPYLPPPEECPGYVPPRKPRASARAGKGTPAQKRPAAKRPAAKRPAASGASRR